MRITLLILLVACFAPPLAYANDLLAEDDFSFDAQPESVDSASWWNHSRLSIEQSVAQGDSLELLRTESRFEYERAPWDGGYLKLDQRAYYFAHKDRQARQQNTDYGHYQLKELWLQHTQDACFGKLGRQNVFWGSVEGTFAVDLIAPFDFTEPLLTDFASVRQTQDLALIECFEGGHQWQGFLLPRATLDRVQHRQQGEYKELESSLNEEWGMRYILQGEGLDVHLMFARLYSNTPVVVVEVISVPISALVPRLAVSRFDMTGVTLVKAIDRLLIEVDLAYKQDQIEAFSGRKLNRWDVSSGFEYTTSSNHAFNAGIWWYSAQPLTVAETLTTGRAITAGWNKTYLNDDLTMSFLGTYLSKPRQHSVTMLAEYQWDDYWSFSSALSYSETQSNAGLASEGWQTTLRAKWQI